MSNLFNLKSDAFDAVVAGTDGLSALAASTQCTPGCRGDGNVFGIADITPPEEAGPSEKKRRIALDVAEGSGARRMPKQLLCTLEDGSQIALKRRTRKAYEDTRGSFTLSLVREQGCSNGENGENGETPLPAEGVSETDKTGKMGKTSKTGALLTEAHRPKSFFDLIGNDRTHRQILKWLKTWSPLVFGTEPVIPTEDPLSRPERQILLLHGPPGVGKTSIVHVAARTLGYDVLEINASDERGGTRVREKMKHAISMHGFTGRPTCVVLDEIDGSEGNFIRWVADLVKSGSLRRPVIAICNNAYGRALDRLRSYCEMVKITRPTVRDVSERLRKICECEKIDLSRGELNGIVQANECDVRSCLNTLQFYRGAVADGKDRKIGWYQMVERVFRRQGNVTKNELFNQLLGELEASGDVDKVVTGCFSSYLTVNHDEDFLERVAKISDWLHFHEIAHRDMYGSSMGSGSGVGGVYLKFVPLAFFSFFSDVYASNFRTNYENVECRDQIRTYQSTFAMMFANFSTWNKYHYMSGNAFVSLLPYLGHILLRREHPFKLSRSYELIKSFGLFGVNYRTGVPPTLQISLAELIEVGKEKAKASYDTTPELDSLILATIERKVKEQEEALKMEKTLELITRRKESIETALPSYNYDITSSLVAGGTHGSTGLATGNGITSSGIGSTTEPLRGTSEKEIDIWVKYNEGYSNAVKKPVIWRNLWI